MEQTENQRLGVEVEQNHSVSCFPATFSPLKPLRRLPFFPKKSIPLYVWCSVYTALGGFIWGFDTGSIGPITVMPQFLSKFGHISPTVQGLIVSCILITASIASIFAGPISERISRTYTIAIGGVVNAIGWAIMCSADGLLQLFAGRLIAGVGEGLFIAMITVYACEIAPAAYRGRIATVVQLFNVVGIAVGFFVCYGTQRIQNDFSWRFPLGLQAVVATAIAIGTPFFPHSPRWLRAVGRTEEAKATWIRLGLSSLEAEKEDENIQRAGQNVLRSVPSTGSRSSE